jgi:uncharacterized protein
MPCLRPQILLLLVLCLMALPALAQQPPLPKEPLTVVTAGGPRKFMVEVTRTPEQMEEGLMFRRSMPLDAGMLFDFKQPTVATMWMKNTLIPLDMLFVDEHGRIVNIAANTVPESLAVIAAAAPVRVVIELNAGVARMLGIKPGDRVEFPIFR